MQLIFLTLLAAARPSFAAPLETEEVRAVLEGLHRPDAVSPKSDVLTSVYAGWIYQVNRDQINAGGHGCDPPWGFIATSRNEFPGYCC
ncbi:hypothetical protein HJFPF1_10745 [Paramyrothecium foliicola]|nr:hypothetical protein HJFPF1_10745 [Paramyrothecium foliicola]